MTTELEEKVTSSLVDGQLPCSIAFQLGRELKASLKEIGETADELGIRIVNCQLGFFQVSKTSRENLGALKMEKPVVERIEASLVDGRLSCPAALGLARKLKVAPKEVGDTATKLRIKIFGCQLGTFGQHDDS